MWETIRNEILQLSWIEALAVILALLYVILAVLENNWCWAAAGVSVSIYIYICLISGLYAETGLQIFYLVMAFYGWQQWKTKEKSNELVLDALPVKTKTEIKLWSANTHIVVIALGAAGSFIMGFFLEQNTDAALPYADSAITIFSVITTFMVTRKILENWIYWVVIDALAAYVYFSRNLKLTAILYFIYVIIAVAGYIRWRKEFSLQKT